MLNITYTAMVGIISILWLIARVFIWKKNKKINWKRELQLQNQEPLTAKKQKSVAHVTATLCAVAALLFRSG